MSRESTLRTAFWQTLVRLLPAPVRATSRHDRTEKDPVHNRARGPGLDRILRLMSFLRNAKSGLGFLGSAGTRYHLWYYRNRVWDTTTWAGVKTLKSPSDMWNYQEILFSLRPSLVIEFGTRFGGSALFFAAVMRQLGNRFRILSVDIDAATVSEKTRHDPDIELLVSSSVDPRVAQRIVTLRKDYPGPVFAILDSDHSKAHVLGEMKLLRPVLNAGDYVAEH